MFIERRRPAPGQRVVVGLPVRNEADRIGACIADLLAQSRVPDAVVCLLNNSDDGTAGLLKRLMAASAVPIHCIERVLPPAQANAGYARRLAMAHAAHLAGPDGIVLTTDADTRFEPDWVSLNLSALDAGADAVCGRAVIDPVEARAIPAHLHRDDALECRYADLLDALAAVLDPDPTDPPVRHTQESGASIAVRTGIFHAVGGIPGVPRGEDRAFVEALRRHDARIRHAPEIAVVVSGRTDGRAEGGMADTMRRRLVRQDRFVDDLLEPPPDAYRRLSFRARLRRAWQAGHADAALIGDLALPAAVVRQALGSGHFGTAWANVQTASPVMRRRRVAFADLPRHIEHARSLLLTAIADGNAPRRVAPVPSMAEG